MLSSCILFCKEHIKTPSYASVLLFLLHYSYKKHYILPTVHDTKLLEQSRAYMMADTEAGWFSLTSCLVVGVVTLAAMWFWWVLLLTRLETCTHHGFGEDCCRLNLKPGHFIQILDRCVDNNSLFLVTPQGARATQIPMAIKNYIALMQHSWWWMNHTVLSLLKRQHLNNSKKNFDFVFFLFVYIITDYLLNINAVKVDNILPWLCFEC